MTGPRRGKFLADCGCCKGACCHSDESCTLEFEEDCDAAGDKWIGAGTTCDDTNCDDDPGGDICVRLVEACPANASGSTADGFILCDCADPPQWPDLPAVDSTYWTTNLVTCDGTRAWTFTDDAAVEWNTFYNNGGAGNTGAGSGAYNNYSLNFTSNASSFTNEYECADLFFHKWVACDLNSADGSGNCVPAGDPCNVNHVYILPIDTSNPNCTDKDVNTGSTINQDNEYLPRVFRVWDDVSDPRCCYVYDGKISMESLPASNFTCVTCDFFETGAGSLDRYHCCNCCSDCMGEFACCDSLPASISWSFTVNCEECTPNQGPNCGDVSGIPWGGEGSGTFTVTATKVTGCDGGSGMVGVDCDLTITEPAGGAANQCNDYTNAFECPDCGTSTTLSASWFDTGGTVTISSGDCAGAEKCLYASTPCSDIVCAEDCTGMIYNGLYYRTGSGGNCCYISDSAERPCPRTILPPNFNRALTSAECSGCGVPGNAICAISSQQYFSDSGNSHCQLATPVCIPGLCDAFISTKVGFGAFVLEDCCE